MSISCARCGRSSTAADQLCMLCRSALDAVAAERIAERERVLKLIGQRFDVAPGFAMYRGEFAALAELIRKGDV